MRKTILKNLSFLTFQDISSNLLGMLFYIVIARKTGNSGLGLYSYAFAVMTLVGMFYDFGTTSYYLRAWCSDASHFMKDISELIGTKTLLIFLSSIPLLLYVLVFDRRYLLFFFLAFLYFALDSFRAVPIAFFGSQNAFNKVLVINLLDRFGGQISAIVFLLLNFQLTSILMVLVVARAVAVVAGYRLLNLNVLPRLKLSTVKLDIGRGALLFFMQVLTTFYFRVDTVIVRRFLGLQASGEYNASYRIIESLLIIPGIVQYAIFPSIAKLIPAKEWDKVKKICDYSLKYLFIISAFIAVFFFHYSREILDFLYGGLFVNSYGILAILGLTIIFLYIQIPFYTVIYAQKKDAQLISRLVVLSVVNVVLNLVLIPRIGLLGAAWATLLTEIFSFVIFLFLLPVKINWKPIIITIVVSLVCTGVFSRIHLPLFVMLISSGSLYLLSLYFLGVIKNSDILMIKEIKS
jgi:O-antigen/teichoic acid export membrane protein